MGQPNGPEYALCITNFNSGQTIERALDTVLSQLVGGDFELIVVDNESRDNSIDYLKTLRRKGIIRKLIVTRCNRGRGRQLAFEHSTAPYILANIDTDVLYADNLLEVVRTYRTRFDGKVLSVYGMMILPSKIAAALGGWRDLDRHEDSDLAVRAFERGLHVHDLSINVVKCHLKGQESFLSRWSEAYLNYRDWFRIGMKPRDLQSLEIFHPLILLAWILHRFQKTYVNPGFSDWFRFWSSRKFYGGGQSATTLEHEAR